MIGWRLCGDGRVARPVVPTPKGTNTELMPGTEGARERRSEHGGLRSQKRQAREESAEERCGLGVFENSPGGHSNIRA